MHFGVLNFSIGPYERLAERWRRFDALGFDHARITDDLLVPGYADFEAWTLLAALARETKRIKIGTLIATVRIRHPAFLAAQVLSLDHITGGGRVAVGIGAGEPEQNEMLGTEPWQPNEVLRRLDEQAAVLSALLRGEPIENVGPSYPTRVKEALQPITRPRPPLIVAAHGRKGMHAAARYADEWNCLSGQLYGYGPKPADQDGGRSLAEAVAETRRLSEQLDGICAEVNRDPSTLRRTILAYRPQPDPFSSVSAFDDFVGSYVEVGISSITFYWPPIDDQLQHQEPSPEAESRFEQVVGKRIPPPAS